MTQLKKKITDLCFVLQRNDKIITIFLDFCIFSESKSALFRKDSRRVDIHYENLPMEYTVIFLEEIEAVLTRTII